MNFYKKIHPNCYRFIITAGKGGDGSASSKMDTKGQRKIPFGGSGGKGGDVYLRLSDRVPSLSHVVVPNVGIDGGDGGAHNRSGCNGEHLYVQVPRGTYAYYLSGKEEDTLVGKIDLDCKELLVAYGGRGGTGSLSDADCKSNGRIAGKMGETVTLLLKEVVHGDIVVVGDSNSGKSALFNKLLNRVNASEENVYYYTTKKVHKGSLTSDYQDALILLDTPSAELVEKDHFRCMVGGSKMYVIVVDADMELACIQSAVNRYLKLACSNQLVYVLLNTKGERIEDPLAKELILTDGKVFVANLKDPKLSLISLVHDFCEKVNGIKIKLQPCAEDATYPEELI